MEKRDRGPGAAGGDVAGAGDVGGVERPGLALGAVDRGVGGGIDDEQGARALDRRVDRGGVGDVAGGA